VDVARADARLRRDLPGLWEGPAMTVDRRTYIGGADAAAVAGVGLWGSPYSVWATKSGLIESEMEPTERMQWGLLLERPVAEEWARREGATDLRKAPFRRHRIKYVAGHPDFLATHPVDGPVLIETKLSDRAHEWTEGDEDRIPLQYFLQVQHYLLITGLRVGYLVVLLRGNEMRSYRIEADDEVQSGLLEAYDDLWRRVITGEAPEVDGHEATAEALRKRYPRADDSEKVADLIEVGLIDQYLAAHRAEVDAKAEKTAAKAKIEGRMGTIARLIAPGAKATWTNNKDRTEVHWEGVAKAYREMHLRFRLAQAGTNADGSPADPELTARVEAATIADLDTIESIHTNTIPGARVLRVTTTKEEQG
jgi:predicted phage-related endonuclease